MIIELITTLSIYLYSGVFDLCLFNLINKLCKAQYLYMFNFIYFNYFFMGLWTTMYSLLFTSIMYLFTINYSFHDNYKDNSSYQWMMNNYGTLCSKLMEYEKQMADKFSIITDNLYVKKTADSLKFFTDQYYNRYHPMLKDIVGNVNKNYKISDKFTELQDKINEAKDVREVTEVTDASEIELSTGIKNLSNLPKLPPNMPDISTMKSSMETMSTMMKDMEKFNKLFENMSSKQKKKINRSMS